MNFPDDIKTVSNVDLDKFSSNSPVELVSGESPALNPYNFSDDKTDRGHTTIRADRIEEAPRAYNSDILEDVIPKKEAKIVENEIKNQILIGSDGRKISETKKKGIYGSLMPWLFSTVETESGTMLTLKLSNETVKVSEKTVKIDTEKKNAIPSKLNNQDVVEIRNKKDESNARVKQNNLKTRVDVKANDIIPFTFSDNCKNSTSCLEKNEGKDKKEKASSKSMEHHPNEPDRSNSEIPSIKRQSPNTCTENIFVTRNAKDSLPTEKTKCTRSAKIDTTRVEEFSPERKKRCHHSISSRNLRDGLRKKIRKLINEVDEVLAEYDESMVKIESAECRDNICSQCRNQIVAETGTGSTTLGRTESAAVANTGSGAVDETGNAISAKTGSSTVSKTESASVARTGSATVAKTGNATVAKTGSATVAKTGSATIGGSQIATVDLSLEGTKEFPINVDITYNI